MDARRKLRLGQFSLRSLLIVLTLASIPCVVVASQKMREARAVHLVQQFNAAMEKQQYDAAESIAAEVEREFPAHPVAEALAWKVHFARMWESVDRSLLDSCLDN